MTYALTTRISRLEGVMRMGECTRCHGRHIAIRGIDPETGMPYLDRCGVPTLHDCEACGRTPAICIDIVGVREEEMP